MTLKSRRQFLEQSMFATAAAVAANAAAPLMAEETKQSSSPNEKLRVCTVGVNGRGMSHVGGMLNRKDTEYVYICDCDTDVAERRAQQVADKQGKKPKIATDIRKVLEDDSVDIITIATPNHWHALAAIWALQAGKDVYVEKPVSHNVSEGRRIVEAAAKYNKICQAGTQSRSNPGMIDVIDFVKNGGIGKINVARGLCYKPRPSIGPVGDYPVPASVDYDLWAGPAPMGPVTRKKFHYDWHWQWPYGNGDLGNQGIHQMDIARWGLGVDELSSQVISYGGRYGYEDAGTTPNTQVIIHNYGDASLVFEVRGLVYDKSLPASSKNYKGSAIGVIFEGSDGYVVIPSYNGGVAFDKDGNKIKEFSGGGDQHHYDNFISAVRSRNADSLNGHIVEGHLSSALCHTGNISYLLGESVSAGECLERLEAIETTENVKATLDRFTEHLKDNKVDLVKDKVKIGPNLKMDGKAETFTGNEAANNLLTREYRKPYEVPAEGKV
ncbi:Gfo/Idh/MocA family oxidoreductase [Blastopirellula sp. JC732]|uniref:Gfo/Idh/MocA family oxidoreductase n=1 Tax=Blastopirellula sediminis TaxID=2894196 RepID=A0A9X1SFW9_9BACT|nr:Gfo/Idh/MocA family oxidoreductase [Blastopirellula sediminis]MCC9609207.1 Gfo/Idh/MocA family oxidoreductase [Blastopirellula sediminis]MCC9628016.1 Gfo/Idh/MocA family oxidoreductase [Blastopirellula sediminis]